VAIILNTLSTMFAVERSKCSIC